MKLLIFRISFLIAHIIALAMAIFVFVTCIINLIAGADYLYPAIYLIALSLGFFYLVVEIIMISKSFVKGTTLMDQLAFHSDTKKIKRGSFIFFIVMAAIFLALLIVGILMSVDIISLKVDETYSSSDAYFIIFVGLTLFIDTLGQVIYTLLFYKDSIFQKIN